MMLQLLESVVVIKSKANVLLKKELSMLVKGVDRENLHKATTLFVSIELILGLVIVFVFRQNFKPINKKLILVIMVQ